MYVNSTSSICVVKYNDLTHRAECKGIWTLLSANESDSHSEGPSQLPFNPGHKGMPFSNGTDGLWKRPNLDGTDRKRGHKGKRGVKDVYCKWVCEKGLVLFSCISASVYLVLALLFCLCDYS